MNSYKNVYAALSIGAMILALTVFVSAQRRGSSYDPYYGQNNVSIGYSVKNLRNNAGRFRSVLDRELDRSRYDGTRVEDNLNNLAKRFRDAAKDLDKEYERNARRGRSSANEARRVVQYGSQLDQALSRSGLAYNNYNLQASWSAIERDLSVIARAYNVGYTGTYGRGNRGPIGGNRGPIVNRGPYNRNLSGTIRNLKNNAKRFEDRVDDIDDRDRWGNRSSSKNLENLANRFKKAVDRLEDRYDDRRDQSRSHNDVRNVLSIGQQLDRELSRARVNRSIRSDWNRIEADLRVLANAYNLRYSGGGGFGIGDIIRDWPF
ncbi:MAG TPA: hypothetical protein VMM38_12390 [Aridibacter sp.]|nr:hypothetical protein [Aridibacter sp.]